MTINVHASSPDENGYVTDDYVTNDDQTVSQEV